jgi:hypothetical protein
MPLLPAQSNDPIQSCVSVTLTISTSVVVCRGLNRRRQQAVWFTPIESAAVPQIVLVRTAGHSPKNTWSKFRQAVATAQLEPAQFQVRRFVVKGSFRA